MDSHAELAGDFRLCRGAEREKYAGASCEEIMLRRKIPGKRLRTFWQRLVLSVLQKRFGGCRIRGNGWHGLAIQATEPNARRIESSLERIYVRVVNVVHERLGSPIRNRGAILVIHVPSSLRVDSVVAAMLFQEESTESAVEGLFVPQYSSAVVSGDPNSPDLLSCCAHELCHALCYDLAGAYGQIPWSFEGFAVEVSDAVSHAESGISVYDLHFRSVRAADLGGSAMSLQRLIKIRDYGELTSGDLSLFCSTAALFFAFLRLKSHSNPHLERLLMEAIYEEVQDPQTFLNRLAMATGQSGRELELEFRQYYLTTEGM